MAISRVLLVSAIATFAFAYVTYARMAYQLPAGSDLILNAPVQTSFNCDNRIYGYYADTDNNCQIFHVCFPILDDIGNLAEMAQFSFVCPNQTLFSQDTLTCAHPEEALACNEAPGLYDVINAEFGRIPTRP